MRNSRAAFTLVEVLVSILVLSLGLTTACGLVFYGIRLVDAARGDRIGQATALSVANDAAALATDETMSPHGRRSEGYLNDLWVVRHESDEVDLGGGYVALTVHVDVYGVYGGGTVASVTRRVVEYRP